MQQHVDNTGNNQYAVDTKAACSMMVTTKATIRNQHDIDVDNIGIAFNWRQKSSKQTAVL